MLISCLQIHIKMWNVDESLMEQKLEAQKEVIKWMRTTPDLAGCGRGNPEE